MKYSISTNISKLDSKVGNITRDEQEYLLLKREFDKYYHAFMTKAFNTLE